MAIVGSAPSALRNRGSVIDAFDLVVRVNNYKLRPWENRLGHRTDVFYSFFGHSIKKRKVDLIRDGVSLCMCKCPNGQPIDSPWHAGERYRGVDFRWIYERRADWWFCDTYIPSETDFLEPFEILGRRMPTTGFACIFELLRFDCELYLTGFDFFTSRVHNVNERWRSGNAEDPIRHAPERERAWLKQYVAKHPERVRLDTVLRRMLT